MSASTKSPYAFADEAKFNIEMVEGMLKEALCLTLRKGFWIIQNSDWIHQDNMPINWDEIDEDNKHIGWGLWDIHSSNWIIGDTKKEAIQNWLDNTLDQDIVIGK